MARNAARLKMVYYPLPPSDALRLRLGYANLGALLTSLGLAYDSDAGRNMAAAITSLMGSTAYRTSAELAAQTQDLIAAEPELLRSTQRQFSRPRQKCRRISRGHCQTP